MFLRDEFCVEVQSLALLSHPLGDSQSDHVMLGNGQSQLTIINLNSSSFLFSYIYSTLDLSVDRKPIKYYFYQLNKLGENTLTIMGLLK